MCSSTFNEVVITRGFITLHLTPNAQTIHEDLVLKPILFKFPVKIQKKPLSWPSTSSLTGFQSVILVVEMKSVSIV